jgi:DNA polymerase IIIc chi subunit
LAAARHQALRQRRPATDLADGTGRAGGGRPNGARFLFLLDGAESARLDRFDRVLDLFDGNDEASLAAARRRWAAAKSAGHALSYWQQGARGWEKKG